MANVAIKSRKVRLSPGKYRFERLIRRRTIRITASSGEWLGLEHVRTICESGMRYSDIPRYCKEYACNLWFGCSYQCNSNQNQGLLNQGHNCPCIPGILEQELGLSKSIFPYLPRDEEMLSEENIVPGTTLTVVAAAWHVTRAMWQQFTVQWLGPSNSIKIQHFRRPVMIVQIVPHATYYVFVFWDGG